MDLAKMDDSDKWRYIAQRLEGWYAQHQRRFYWRVNRLSPYEILILEILLWKTKAEFVDAMFQEFISQYSTPEKLNEVSIDELERKLEPIGLYKRRARLLKQIAEALVKEHQGNVPRDLKALMKLPGVGQYIAQAVMCFGFDEPIFPIDSNILRFFERVWDLKLQYPRKVLPEIQKKMKNLLQSPEDSAAERMKHLLDFMGVACKAVRPICQEGESCPLQEVCFYYKNNKIGDFQENE